LPLPSVDRREQARAAARDVERISAAERTPLPYLVRAAGDAFRRAGDAEARNDVAKLGELERELQTRVIAARKRHGDEPLLALRAIQTDLFVRAVHRWTDTAGSDDDLTGLGGAFVDRAKRNGWVDAKRRLAFDDDALGALFAIRWSSLSGLATTFPFAPTLNEWRQYFRTLIEHPERRARTSDPLDQASALDGYVSALGRHDPDYPILLARGILQLREGHAESARTFLATYLEQNPTGPWRLRAQNYLASAYGSGAAASPPR
jgi:hypothetical protein